MKRNARLPIVLGALVLGLASGLVAGAKAAESYRQVAGPVAIHSRLTRATPVASLARGKQYLVAVSGTFTYWNTGGLCDGCHIIRRPEGGGFQVFPTLRFFFPSATMIDLVTLQTGRPPVYAANHVYTARINGEGFVLSAMIQDGVGEYINNHGSLYVTVYEIVSSPTQPNPPSGLTSVSVQRSPVVIKLWDHGSEDGDVVQVYVDGRLHSTVRLTKAGTTLRLPLPFGHHRFQVRAMNEGSQGPNTASMSISSVTAGRATQDWSLKTGQVATMDIHVHP
jgi:hypothetical protein